jgi:hypothetical protein
MLAAAIALLLTAPTVPAAVQPASAMPALPILTGPDIHVQGQRHKWDPQRIVCKELDQPGSRLNVKRVCRSMLEWASDRREDQQLLIQKQYNGAP